MSSDFEMSLDEIIKKKNKAKLSKPIPAAKHKTKKPFPMKYPNTSPEKFPITDARNKIINLKRKQITDARDKLAALAKQKDARLKLNKLRQDRAGHASTGVQAFRQGKSLAQNHGNQMWNVPHPSRVFADATRHIGYQMPGPIRIPKNHPLNPKKFLENRTIGNKLHGRTERTPRPSTIVRTIQNDLESIDDPMEDHYSPPRPTLHNRKASMQLKIIAHNDAVESRLSHRTAAPRREKSPPRPPSILKKYPPTKRSEDIIPKVEKPALEYRIIVSNLRNTVTGGDIEELFGDIGNMLESRLVRPGTAEVIYKTQEDAQKAVDLYHNRQLDGQPMNCLLVTPRSQSVLQRMSNKTALYSTNSNVEPDANTFLKVLFNNQ